MHFVTQLYMPKRIFCLTLQLKFAIIDCDCVGKKRFLLNQLLNYRKSHAEWFSRERTGGWDKTFKKAFIDALVLTLQNSRKIQNPVKNKATMNAP